MRQLHQQKLWFSQRRGQGAGCRAQGGGFGALKIVQFQGRLAYTILDFRFWIEKGLIGKILGNPFVAIILQFGIT
jgi:hypothetical protein